MMQGRKQHGGGGCGGGDGGPTQSNNNNNGDDGGNANNSEDGGHVKVSTLNGPFYDIIAGPVKYHYDYSILELSGDDLWKQHPALHVYEKSNFQSRYTSFKSKMKSKQQRQLQLQGDDGYSSDHTEISHQSFTPSTPPVKKMFQPTDIHLLTPSRRYLEVPGTPMPQINNMFLAALQEKNKLRMHFIEQETLAQQSSNATSLDLQKITTEAIERRDKDASARRAQYAEEGLVELDTIMSLSSRNLLPSDLPEINEGKELTPTKMTASTMSAPPSPTGFKQAATAASPLDTRKRPAVSPSAGRKRSAVSPSAGRKRPAASPSATRKRPAPSPSVGYKPSAAADNIASLSAAAGSTSADGRNCSTSTSTFTTSTVRKAPKVEASTSSTFTMSTVPKAPNNVEAMPKTPPLTVVPVFAARPLDCAEESGSEVLCVDKINAPHLEWEFASLSSTLLEIDSTLKEGTNMKYKYYIAGDRNSPFQTTFRALSMQPANGAHENTALQVPYFIVHAVEEDLPDPDEVFVVVPENNTGKGITTSQIGEGKKHVWKDISGGGLTVKMLHSTFKSTPTRKFDKLLFEEAAVWFPPRFNINNQNPFESFVLSIPASEDTDADTVYIDMEMFKFARHEFLTRMVQDCDEAAEQAETVDLDWKNLSEKEKKKKIWNDTYLAAEDTEWYKQMTSVEFIDYFFEYYEQELAHVENSRELVEEEAKRALTVHREVLLQQYDSFSSDLAKRIQATTKHFKVLPSNKGLQGTLASGRLEYINEIIGKATAVFPLVNQHF